jgi:xylulokinase
VNYTTDLKRLGVLLCINGAGIMNRWIRSMAGEGLSYGQMNEVAATIAAGSDGLLIFPFGNGAERMLNNTTPGARINNIDLIKHGKPYLFRAVQEGIAFAFRYGLDIMKENGMRPHLIRAGRANMFLSSLFVDSFVNVLQVPVELYESDGSVGAAMGAGLGAGIFASPKEAFTRTKKTSLVEPGSGDQYEGLYQNWLGELKKQ